MALRMVKKAGARGRTRWVGFTATAFALIALTALVFPKIAQAWVSDNVLSQNTVQGVSPNGTTIDLFDYWTTSDGSENDSYNYNGGINNGHQLKFNTGTPQSASDVINSWTGAGNGPRTGIVENTLTDGYPTIAAGIISGWVNLNNNNNGRGGSQTLTEESLAYLFDNSTQDGKQGYYDVQGLLQVDSDGYYYYNASSAQTTDAGGSFQSANYATFDSGTNSFTLYDTWAVANEGTNSPDGQFFPFSDANDVFNSYDGRLTADTDIKASSNDLNHYFGMHMSTQFVQQYGGHTEENGDIVTYEFSGDDDVWIYIDDVLVADLGGIHDAASVTIDFSTGEIHVYDVTGTDVTPSNMNTLRECYETAGAANTVEWSNNGNTFADNTYHTLDFFYLERGNSDSNMSLKYNLVNIPETDISKVDQEGNYVAGAEFAVYNTTDGKTTTSENLICNATTESDGTVTLLDADGYPITLKSLYEEDGVRNITLVETKTPDGYRSVSEVPLYIQRYENTPNGDPVYLLLSSDPWTTGAYAQPKVTASAENDVKITTNSGEQTLTSEQKQDGVMFIVIEKKVNGDWYPVTGNALDGWTVYDDNTTASIAQAGKETNAIFTISTSGAYEAEVENLPGRIQDYEYFAGESGTYRAAYYYTSASTLDNANESNTFPISNSGEFYREFSARVYVSNIVNRVLVQKTDESGNAVDGATMALFSADDVDVAEDGTATLKQGVTAEDALQTATTRTLTEEADSIDLAGAAAFTGLEPGTYYVAELSAPDGYAVNGTLAKIVVDGTGVYADAGTEGDGVTVTRGVGRIVRSMLQFATADDVDATLRNIVATPQLGTQGSDGTLSWQDNEGAQVQHLQYDDDGNSVLDYALQDGSKAYTVDEGMPRLTVKQCSTHLSEPRQDVSSYDLTNLFTGVTIVHIADEQVGGLDVTKQVEGDGADAGATFSFTVTFTHAATEGASATPLTQDEADAAGMQLAIGDGAATDVTVGEDGTVTFMLADGQTAHFTNVPAGVTYTVEEAAASGFETSYDSAATGPIEFNKTASTTVTNTVRPEAVLDGESALAVTKTVNTPTERDFSFELSLTSAKDSAGSDLSGSVFETDENGDLVAFNGMTATIDGSFTEGDGLSQTARFGKLVFTDPGTYTFSVSEVVPEATDGWTYQTTPQTVTVTVKDDFTVDVAYEGDATSAAFTNTYGATGELPMDGSGSIALSKTLTGRDWVEGDSFTFTLTGKNVTVGSASGAASGLTIGSDAVLVADASGQTSVTGSTLEAGAGIAFDNVGLDLAAGETTQTVTIAGATGDESVRLDNILWSYDFDDGTDVFTLRERTAAEYAEIGLTDGDVIDFYEDLDADSALRDRLDSGNYRGEANLKAGMNLAAAAGVQTAAIQGAELGIDAVSRRASLTRSYADGVTGYAEVSGVYRTMGGNADMNEMKVELGGVVVGGDFTSGDWTVGALANVGTGSVRGAGDNRGVENDVDYYGVEAYAAKRFGQFNVVGHVGYTRTKNDLTDSSIGYAKVDDLDADVWNVGVRGEMQFAVTDKSRLVPYVGINYLRVSTDGYTTSQGVSVSSEDQNLFTVPVGVAFKGTMTTASGWNWSPSADVAYVGAFGDRDVEATTRDGLASGSVSMDVWSENVVRTSFGLEAEKGGFGIGAMAGLAVGSDDTTGAFGQIRVHYAF